MQHSYYSKAEKTKDMIVLSRCLIYPTKVSSTKSSQTQKIEVEIEIDDGLMKEIPLMYLVMKMMRLDLK